jgi:glucose-1-phosphate adenylyltransferase
MNDVLTLILGGGRGARLFPLTHMRSKPAVPLGGKYRLIDIPISNCLHAGLKQIFVLTQFNSASLNRHVAQTYRLDLFSHGFVEVLAAEQTPDSLDWFQGTADAVRQAARHFREIEADYFLILAGDHLYRMDFNQLIETHIESDADITVAAHPVSAPDAIGMGVLQFDDMGQIKGFEEKPTPERLAALGASLPKGALAGVTTRDRPFVVSMGIYVFTREVLLEILEQPGVDFGREIIPSAIATHVVHPFIFRGYWADLGTIESFYEANIQLTRRDAPFSFFHARWPIYTHPRFLPATRVFDSRLESSIVAEGCYLDRCDVSDSVVGIRTRVSPGAVITRSVLLGADFYEEETDASDVPLGIGREVVLDRVIVDKNARIGDGVRLVNEAGTQHADGDGYFIRNGIIVVPKGATLGSGLTV